MARTRTMAVLGNGIIGHGIAEVFAGAGWRVHLVGRDAKSLAAARAKIATSLKLFVANKLVTDAGRKAALARIKTTEV
jgi:3-hydroxybutyryl-CoA dehydrogenase